MSAFLKRAAMVATGATVLSLGLGLGQSAQAISVNIVAETNGFDSGLDRVLGLNSFFNVGFKASEDPNAYIKSVKFDLRAGGDKDAAFDNQDFLVFDARPAVGQTGGGLNANAISFSSVNRNDFVNAAQGKTTSSLIVNFLPQAFKPGSFFSFGVDTNAVGTDSFPFLALLSAFTGDDVTTFNDTGADFGRAGVAFIVDLMKGDGSSATVSSTFRTTGLYASQAQITNAPEPLTILGSALALGFGARLKKKRSLQSAKATVA